MDLLSLHPQHLPLKYNLALCLYQQADTLFNQEIRRVSQTRQAIQYLVQSLKLFHLIQHLSPFQFHFHRTCDLSPSLRNLSVEIYNEMLKVAENKVYLIEDMLQIS